MTSFSSLNWTPADFRWSDSRSSTSGIHGGGLQNGTFLGDRSYFRSTVSIAWSCASAAFSSYGTVPSSLAQCGWRNEWNRAPRPGTLYASFKLRLKERDRLTNLRKHCHAIRVDKQMLVNVGWEDRHGGIWWSVV